MGLGQFTLRAIIFTLIFNIVKSPIFLLLAGFIVGIMTYHLEPKATQERLCEMSTFVYEKTNVALYSDEQCEAQNLRFQLDQYNDNLYNQQIKKGF